MKKLKFNKNGLALARRIATEGSVLLKNNGVLPLKKNEKIALFGRNQCDTYKGGGGAADLWAVKCQPYCDGLEKAGNVYKPLLKNTVILHGQTMTRRLENSTILSITTNTHFPRFALPMPRLKVRQKIAMSLLSS